MTDQHYQRLLDSLIAQAKYFLEESGEFYPYGSVIDADLKIKPIGYYSEVEYPESTEVLNQLETAVRAGLKNGKYLAAIIGVNVLINSDGNVTTEKKSALQLRTYLKDDESVLIQYSLFEQHEDGYVFGDLFEL